jgi:peptide/nickel transport system permease protein
VSAALGLFRRFNGAVGLALLLAVIAAAALGDLARHDPLRLDLAARLLPPSAEHWFGTDQFGRDVLARVLAGARASLAISLMSVALAIGGGLGLGVIAGFFGGWIDRAIAIVVDAVMAFPSLLLALGIMTVFGPSRYGVVLALGAAYAPAVIRVTRGAVLSLREKEFVEASAALGNTKLTTLWLHVLPNCLTPVIVLSSSLLAAAILSESALSFLGLGVPPPAPTWGGMLADSRQFVSSAAWLAVFPGLAISIALLAFNLTGDALRDLLDPRMNNL